MKTKDLTYAGSVCVDSGQIMIGDPCYLNDWDPNTNDEWNVEGKQGEYSYFGACATTLNANVGELGTMTSVVMSSGYGDGVYPVFVKFNEDGRVSMAVIDFDNELGLEVE